MTEKPDDEETARQLKLLGHPKRIAIIRLLHTSPERELASGKILAGIGGGQPNCSIQLGLLKEGKILTSRKEGVRIFYSLTSPRWMKILTLAAEK